MADLNERQFAWARSELGEKPSDAELNAAFDRLGSVRDVVLEALRTRRAKWLSSPMSVNLSGVASLNLDANVKAIERQIQQIAKLDSDPSDMSANDALDVAGESRPVEIIPIARTRSR